MLTYKPPAPNISGPKWNGRVLVAMSIDKQGTPINIRIARSLCSGDARRDDHTDCAGADKYAIDFVAHWKFRSATKCGEPIEFPATAAVDFDTHQ